MGILCTTKARIYQKVVRFCCNSSYGGKTLINETDLTVGECEHWFRFADGTRNIKCDNDVKKGKLTIHN